MAAIVYLDVDDEITSAAARIRALEDERIALVLPLGSRLATSRINFRLLAREAEVRGRRIEIVTNDASARALAASAGLPTHLSVSAFEGAGAAPAQHAAQHAPPPHPDRDDSPTLVLPAIRPPSEHAPVPQVGHRKVRRRGPLVGVILLLITLVGAGGGVAFLLLPSAEIVLTPAMNTIGPIHLQVTAQVGVTQPDPVNLLVPATRFTFDLKSTATFPSTGLNVVETVASGQVTFENCDTGGAVTIPDGSIVATAGGIGFRTVARISLKRARIFPFACDAGTVGVEAVAPGETGNVPAGQINQIPDGFDAVVLRVANEQPTTGGTHTETPFVQQADLDAAFEALFEAIATNFEEQLAGASGVPEGTTIFPETKFIGIVTPSVDPASLVATEVAEFELGYVAQGTVLGVDPAPVRTLSDARVRTEVAKGFRLVEDSMSIDVGEPVVIGSAITFPVTVGATQVRVVDGAA
ncbi:MAG: Baseplate protein, partial [Chloroflexi bacterium]|nr:Baseplate protein [Chloroflexota bacterium]